MFQQFLQCSDSKEALVLLNGAYRECDFLIFKSNDVNHKKLIWPNCSTNKTNEDKEFLFLKSYEFLKYRSFCLILMCYGLFQNPHPPMDCTGKPERVML